MIKNKLILIMNDELIKITHRDDEQGVSIRPA